MTLDQESGVEEKSPIDFTNLKLDCVCYFPGEAGVYS
jgi:hypothetical protein